MPPWMFLLCGGLPTLWGTVGDFFFFVRCDELSDFPPSRLKVQHIPGCTGQYDFNLFSQAGSTDRHNLVWNSSPTSLWDLQCLLVDIPEGESRVAAVFVSHMCWPSKHLSLMPAITSLHCHIFQGHHAGGTPMAHMALSQLKKQNVKGQGDVRAWRITVLIQQRQIRVCLSLCKADFTGPSQSAGLSVKDTPKPLWKIWGDELWHQRGWLLVMTRGGRWNNLTGGVVHHRPGMRSAKVVCSRAEKTRRHRL